MPTRPQLLVLDVNETLSDLTGLRGRFEQIGADAGLMPLWFAGVLRDGFALTAAGGYAPFAQVARDGLRALLVRTPARPESADLEAAIDHVVSGFGELDLHSDVPEGVRALHAAGYRLATMTNGSVAVTEQLLTRAGVRQCFEALWDVSGPGCWKPDLRAYHYATGLAGVRPEQAMLVAVHPWDVDGAQRAGLAGAWLARGIPDLAYPSALTEPSLTAQDLTDLAHQLG